MMAICPFGTSGTGLPKCSITSNKTSIFNAAVVPATFSKEMLHDVQNNQHLNTLLTFNKLHFQLVFFWVASPHGGCRF
jgi:phosphoserine aminotransferase